MQRLTPLEKDYYLDADDFGGGRRSDDDEESGSSEDEVQRMFADIAGVQLPSQRKRQIKHDRSFEAEMELELDASFKNHNESWTGTNSTASSSVGGASRGQQRRKEIKQEKKELPTPSKSSTDVQKKEQKHEEDVDPALGLHDRGTESDEEFQRQEGLKGPEDEEDNDQLLYDPDEDDANQNWIDIHRRSYQPEPIGQRPLPKSDAVLNCPACMTVLCLDCQRHEIYKTQYRAMFVMNCDVKRDELLFQPKSAKRGGAKNRKRDGSTAMKTGQRMSANDYDAETIEDMKRNSRPEDLFYPVQCQVCTTEVGVYDSDEIYHFFNVLASHA